MDETQQVSNQNPITPVPPIDTYPTPQPAPTSKTPWILISLIVILLGVASYFGYQNYQLKQQLNIQQPKENKQSQSEDTNNKPQPTPQASIESKAGWKPYSANGYSLMLPEDWQNLESSCQKLDISVTNFTTPPTNIRDYVKQSYGMSDNNISEITSNLPEKYIFNLPNISKGNYMVLGPLGEAELNNIAIVDSKRGVKIVVWFNGNPEGDNTHCLGDVENIYKEIISTIKLTN